MSTISYKQKMGFRIQETIKGIELVFKTEEGVFSPHKVDNGTLAMLSVVEFGEQDKVLDLGCGYGVVGILAAKLINEDSVVMLDNNDLAVKLTKENAEMNGVGLIRIINSEGFKSLDEKDFTLILSNPPYHTDFSVAREFVEKGFNRLVTGGRMYMVTKRDLWYRNKLTSIFGGVRVWEIDDYFVFMSVKKSINYASKEKGRR